MKRFFSKAAFVVALGSMASIGHAQVMTVNSGTTTIKLDAGFINSLGAYITDLQGNPLQNNSITFTGVAGALDLQTAAGEIEHKGGMIINAGGMVIRLENFTLDTHYPPAAVISAEFIMNGHYDFRLPLFSVQAPPGFMIPLTLLPSGALQQNNLILTIAPETAGTFYALFGGPVVQPGAYAGTANSYIVFSN
jgi:hypothetical protein